MSERTRCYMCEPFYTTVTTVAVPPPMKTCELCHQNFYDYLELEPPDSEKAIQQRIRAAVQKAHDLPDVQEAVIKKLDLVSRDAIQAGTDAALERAADFVLSLCDPTGTFGNHYQRMRVEVAQQIRALIGKPSALEAHDAKAYRQGFIEGWYSNYEAPCKCGQLHTCG